MLNDRLNGRKNENKTTRIIDIQIYTKRMAVAFFFFYFMSMKQLKTQYFEPSLSSWVIIPVHPAHVISAIFFSQKALRLD